jgi:hypothetical protein
MNLLCSEWVSVHLAQKRNHNRDMTGKYNNPKLNRARHRAQYRAHLKSLQVAELFCGKVLWSLDIESNM